MKTGILTFHRTTNYGAALQAYALKKKLTDMGVQAEIIDYRNMNIYSYSDPSFFKGLALKTRIGKVLRYPYNKAIYTRFVAFWEKWMKLSQICATPEELRQVEKTYDAVICGSDQVWNPRAIFKDFDAFLLGTADCKKIAYAASAGNVSLWEPYLKTYWKLLHRFDAISVREQDMRLPTERLSQKNVEVVLDPTLLLSQSDWCEVEEPAFGEQLPSNGYILVYFLGKNPAVVQAVQELHKRTGLPVVSLGRKVNGVKAIRPIAGPSEFLTLFHHASYVLTSSFHGTVFSIQYQKPFLVFGNGTYNSRMNTLLDALGLKERMMGSEVASVTERINSTIHWEQVQLCHMQEKKRSLAFLQKALHENREE